MKPIIVCCPCAVQVMGNYSTAGISGKAMLRRGLLLWGADGMLLLLRRLLLLRIHIAWTPHGIGGDVMRRG